MNTRLRGAALYIALITFVVVAIAAGCSDRADEAPPPPSTGDRIADEIIGAMLARDDDTILRYWYLLPCVAAEEEGAPKCHGDERPGDLVRDGARQCDEGPVQLESMDIGVPDGWEVYSVEAETLRGIKYRVIFSPDGKPDERTVMIEFRTFPDVPAIPTAFMTYEETCKTARELTAEVEEFLILPPNQR